MAPSSEQQQLEIPASDIVKLIQQFLREHGLGSSLAALESETGVSLRIPESRLELLGGIRSGDWERVLGMLRPLRLPPSRLVDLYELVFRDLLVLGEQSGAASLLSAAEPFIFLQETDTPRFFELQELTMIPSKDLTEARLYPGPTKDERRAAAAADLENHLDSVEPGRLLKLIGQALKYQAEKGLIPVETAYDLFKGGPLVLKAEDDETPLSEPFQTLPPFSRTQHPEAVVFSPDGQFLVTGTVDGFIEVWNYMTGKLRKDLEWQARDAIMMMESAVLCLSFSADSQFLVSGAQDGRIKTWRMATGQCVKKFTPAHAQGVTSVAFNRDGTHVLSASFDQTVRIHGTKSGKMLKEFRGHSSFVNEALYAENDTKILSGSSDGSVKIWDVKSTTCLQTLRFSQGQLGGVSELISPGVVQILPSPIHPYQFLVINRSGIAYTLDSSKGSLVRAFKQDQNTDPKNKTKAVDNFAAGAASPHGRFTYLVTEHGALTMYKTETGEFVDSFPITENGKEVIGLAHHPFANVLVSFDEMGLVKLWRP